MTNNNQKTSFTNTMISTIEVVLQLGVIILSLSGIFFGYLIAGLVTYFLFNLGFVWLYIKTGKGIIGKTIFKSKQLKIVLCVIYPVMIFIIKLMATQ